MSRRERERERELALSPSLPLSSARSLSLARSLTLLPQEYTPLFFLIPTSSFSRLTLTRSLTHSQEEERRRPLSSSLFSLSVSLSLTRMRVLSFSLPLRSPYFSVYCASGKRLVLKREVCIPEEEECVRERVGVRDSESEWKRETKFAFSPSLSLFRSLTLAHSRTHSQEEERKRATEIAAAAKEEADRYICIHCCTCVLSNET